MNLFLRALLLAAVALMVGAGIVEAGNLLGVFNDDVPVAGYGGENRYGISSQMAREADRAYRVLSRGVTTSTLLANFDCNLSLCKALQAGALPGPLAGTVFCVVTNDVAHLFPRLAARPGIRMLRKNPFIKPMAPTLAKTPARRRRLDS